MNCLNCGHESQFALCPNCRSKETVNKIYNAMTRSKPDTTDLPYVVAYRNSFGKATEAVRACWPELVEQLEEPLASYYRILLMSYLRDPALPHLAQEWLTSHIEVDLHWQRVLYSLLSFWGRDEFDAPLLWCERIRNMDDLCCELYETAAQYFSMIGDYDIADELIGRASVLCRSADDTGFLFRTREEMVQRLEKLSDLVKRYRNGQPYWPITEARRQAVAKHYDMRHIAHPPVLAGWTHMKCLNCGCDSQYALCPDCRTEEIIDKTYGALRARDPEEYGMPFVTQYRASFEKAFDAVRSCWPKLIGQLDEPLSSFYRIRMMSYFHDPQMPKEAAEWLTNHEDADIHWQWIMYSLLIFWDRDDFEAPIPWCERIWKMGGLCAELYEAVAQFYAMIGEYDRAEELINRALGGIHDSKDGLLFMKPEAMQEKLERLATSVKRYKSGKPYWPTTESRRRAVARHYDARGIDYPRIEPWPKKVSEADFKPINEAEDYYIEDYCSFWCLAAGKLGHESPYQLAALRVRNGQVVSEFSRMVRPVDGGKMVETVSKKAGVAPEIVRKWADLDHAYQDFIDFAGGDTLVSTDALGNHAKIICRAARYAGYDHIDNSFLDLLDYAMEVSESFNAIHNRENLLNALGIKEGEDALMKAKVNVSIFEKLKKMDGTKGL